MLGFVPLLFPEIVATVTPPLCVHGDATGAVDVRTRAPRFAVIVSAGEPIAAVGVGARATMPVAVRAIREAC